MDSREMDLMEAVEREVKRLERKDILSTCLSADAPLSRPTEGQIAIFRAINSPLKIQYIQGGNQSGKTSSIIRNLVWMLEDTHPYWERPTSKRCPNKLCLNTNITPYGAASAPRFCCPLCGNTWESWENESITVMLVGQDHKNLMLNLYEPRIKPLLSEPEKWKPQKVGPYIGWLQHEDTNDKIIFFPHGHGSEKARTATQGFTIHGVFLDELAPVTIIEELQRRIMAKLGLFQAAFTMKTTDPAVVRFQNAQQKAGAAILFRLSMLDNPKYAGSHDMIRASLAGLSKEKQDNILYGDIGDSDDRVFSIDEELVRTEGLPAGYNSSWRHVEIVDPAIQSKAGYVILAQDRSTGIWHVVRAEYITGMQDQNDLLDECEARSKNLSIALRISDNQAWFVNPAKRRNLRYVTPPNKQGKGGKVFLIKKAQMFLASGKICIPSQFEDIWYELDSYRWKPGGSMEIVNSNAYHLIDCIVYFADVMPKDEIEPETPESMDAMIRRFNRMVHGSSKHPAATKKLPPNRPATRILKGEAARKVLDKMGLGGGRKWKV
jgi:hypothetical protein